MDQESPKLVKNREGLSVLFKSEQKTMSKLRLGMFVGIPTIAVVGVGGFLFYDYSQFEPTAWPKYELPDGTAISGNHATVESELATWWDDHKDQPFTLTSKELKTQGYDTTLSNLGTEINAEETLKQVSYTSWWSDLRGEYKITSEEMKTITLKPVFDFDSSDFSEVANFVEENKRDISPAKAELNGEEIKLTYESSGVDLDSKLLPDSISEAVLSQSSAKIPLKVGEKKVKNSELEKITMVMSRFSTKFNSGKISRSANIKLAAETINGLVLLPGESFSFNEYLGRRTTAKGYKVAGVYVSGRHDVDVGGGICQVSTTLYNAAIKSMVEVNTRNPHSLPVPYVPLGQDAAVSFPNPDLKLTNNYDFPIALSSKYTPGTLEFAVLGSEEPEYEVKFENKFISSWSNGEKVVHDGSLAYGVRKVVDRGGSGRKVKSYRLLYKDGKLVKREPMGESIYRGGPRIVAVNKNAKKPAPKKPEGLGEATSTPASTSGDTSDDS